MTATNHTATGMVLLALVPHPLMLPVALLSHFVLDALPHFKMDTFGQRLFERILLTDIIMAATLLVLVLTRQPLHWPLIMSAGVVAASPDLLWFPYRHDLQQLSATKLDPLRCWLVRIQWCERPWGWVVELPLLVVMLILLARLHII